MSYWREQIRHESKVIKVIKHNVMYIYLPIQLYNLDRYYIDLDKFD